jgi:hypothetical protein
MDITNNYRTSMETHATLNLLLQCFRDNPAKLYLSTHHRFGNTYKGIMKRENLQDVKLTQTKCQNLFMSKIDCLKLVGHISPCQKLIACNKLAMVMGGMSYRGGSKEVVKTYMYHLT